MLRFAVILNSVVAVVFVGLFLWGLTMRLFDWWWLLFALLAASIARSTKQKMDKEKKERGSPKKKPEKGVMG